jgi:hypothetical protein
MLNTLPLIGLFTTAVLAVCLITQVRAHSAAATASSSQSPYTAMAPESVKWIEVGNETEFAVLSGSPDAEGSPFVLRLRFCRPSAYCSALASGRRTYCCFGRNLLYGNGREIQPIDGKRDAAGSYGYMPKEMQHFGWAKGTTIIQIHGVGPFKTNWVESVGRPATN